MPRLSRRAVLTGLLTGSAYALTGCGDPTSPSSPANPNSIYVMGDSLTAGDSPDFLAGRYGEASWVSHLDSRLTVVGGWARDGALTADLLEAAEPSDAGTLLLLTGTNDLAAGIAFETTTYNLRHVAERVGAPRVVVSTLPPRDDRPNGVLTFNRNLTTLTRDQGWTLIDPMEGVRDGVRFGDGMSTDGLHLSVAGATEVGRSMSETLLERP